MINPFPSHVDVSSLIHLLSLIQSDVNNPKFHCRSSYSETHNTLCLYVSKRGERSPYIDIQLWGDRLNDVRVGKLSVSVNRIHPLDTNKIISAVRSICFAVDKNDAKLIGNKLTDNIQTFLA